MQHLGREGASLAGIFNKVEEQGSKIDNLFQTIEEDFRPVITEVSWEGNNTVTTRPSETLFIKGIANSKTDLNVYRNSERVLSGLYVQELVSIDLIAGLNRIVVELKNEAKGDTRAISMWRL